jgi:16S rRNA (uracil1498-N3)-methyltransferase
VYDGSGEEERARIVRLSPRDGEAVILERFAGQAESRTRVRLYQAVTKGERFEWLIEKATELGVAGIRPLLTARSVVKPDAGGGRADRWRRIATEAAEQCGRSAVPGTGAPITLDDALAAPGVTLLPFEGAGDGAPNIHRAIDALIDDVFASSVVNILIGPEGGFEEAEVARAGAAGAAIVTMGRRVLRSETAGLVALTLVMDALGELG